MGRQEFLLLTMNLLLVSVAVVYGQDPTSGFISIDCGRPKGYKRNDTKTGIIYVSDSDFIDTGEIHKVSGERPHGSTHFKQLDKLRSFPNGVRNCYRMKPVHQGARHLVRLQFLYGNYDGKNQTPTFDIYLGINFWWRITRKYYFYEAVVTATSESISVCLVNIDDGTPFISAIELRPLPGTLYPGVDSTNQLMYSIYQWNYGSDHTEWYDVRYPEDAYDRRWQGRILPRYIIVNTSSNIHSSSSNDGFKTPTDVMKTAVSPKNESSSIDVDLTVNNKLQQKYPSARIYCAMHFAEIEDLKASNDTRNFRILWNGDIWVDNITPKYLTTDTYYTRKMKPYESTKLSIRSTNESTKPPIINALEYYVVVNITQLETDIGDNNAILRVKAMYNLTGRSWSGDPCLPTDFQWDGLNCSNDGSSSPRIISLNLSSSNLTGEIAPSLANLTKLQSLDLSSNGLTGKIPSFLAYLPHLEFLNLTENNLSGSIPKEFLDRSANGSLKLSIDENPFLCIELGSCKKGSKKIVTVVVSTIGVALILLTLVLGVVWRLRRQQVLKQIQLQRSPLSLHLESKQFTYHEIVEITNNFLKQIGRGGFGTVYHGIYKNNTEVAVKMLSCSSSQGTEEFQTEALLLTKIHHRNLVTLIGYCDDIDHHALVYEYMTGGNLADYLTGNLDKDTFCWRERLCIASEAAQGLEYLHKGCKPTIIHRDIKTSNILLTQNMRAKIADFGLSKIFQTDSITHVSTKIVGTPGYLDPEYYTSSQLNEKSDVYSFGIVLMELITGLPAIMKPENIHIASWVQERVERGEIPEIIDKRLKQDYAITTIQKVVEKAIACTARESQRRPSISKVLALLNDCLEFEMAYQNSESLGTTGLDSGNSFESEVSHTTYLSLINPASS